MKSDSDRLYYAARARIERERAETSKDSAAAVAHLAMAEEYERRAQAADPETVIALRAWSAPGREHSVH